MNLPDLERLTKENKQFRIEGEILLTQGIWALLKKTEVNSMLRSTKQRPREVGTFRK
jgi:serine/threonine protein phosphatase PrpC